MSAENDGEDTIVRRKWLDAVVEYYDHTRFDYWAVWHNRDNYAFHFGYYGGGVREHAHALNNSNSVLAEVARVSAGDRVLDAGCGLGGSSFWLAANRGAEVVGITPVAHQVAKAKKIARARALEDRVRFELADYTRMPFPAASFDVVWALESLCHATNKPAFYREAARVLRPGGRLVVAEYMRMSRSLGANTEALLREWLDGWSIPDLDSSAEHRAGAAQAGFADIQLADNTPAARPSLRRLYKLAYVIGPFDLALHHLGLRSKAQHGNVLASLRQYQLLRQGAWFYGILSATKW